ncbi:MAG: flagellar biosynthesis protein FlhB [Candidatus Schekmanbacteria bacterium RBG_13_48_7]|uniref:Flagellar biosynthetic protein FlhB n=1 Tax=Candidatus Schekmanbacteria bacterium RBG_13_48_7 TaxID=1817878 RepID=A0A1F7RS85_9BACT|nr:MAG: flagellar biosynthesis protein FlhB [Candidatus Schekmanbacteria bacterium RBG_13_48_7]
MPGDKGERTEAPTPRRRRDARKKGQIPRSREIPSAVILLGSLMFLYVLGFNGVKAVFSVMHQSFTLCGSGKLETSIFLDIVRENLIHTLLIISPFLLFILGIGFAGNILQGGLIFTTEKLKFDIKKLNPVQGISKIMLSKRSLGELAKNLLKLGLIFYISFITIRSSLPEIFNSTNLSIAGIFVFLLNTIFKLFFRICILIIALAVIDYYLQKRLFEENLKMTKQEVKEDLKQTEGDPKVKGKIRSMQRQLSFRRMMQRVPEADVVITNPDHLAIALKYERTNNNAPIVIAKGKNNIAEKIREIARQHAIPIIEDKPLAQALYKIVEIGSEIPETLYKAVAEVLAYVYRINKRNYGQEIL